MTEEETERIGRTQFEDRRPGAALLAFAAGVCMEGKLPIVTLNPKRYSRIKGVRVVPARLLL